MHASLLIGDEAHDEPRRLRDALASGAVRLADVGVEVNMSGAALVGVVGVVGLLLCQRRQQAVDACLRRLLQ